MLDSMKLKCQSFSHQFSNEVNQENIARKEFLNLWKQINRKTSYQVEFDDAELVKHSVDYINEKLVVSKPSFHITKASATEMSKEVRTSI